MTLAALALAACADRAPTAPGALPRPSAAEAEGLWAEQVTGETGPGSRYALSVPANWNGDVVFYAHGIRDPLAPVELEDQDGWYAVRDALGAEGYGVAYSSFSENGFALKDGAQQTHQLRGLFASRYGTPRRSFLMGHSLGGMVALMLAEEHPDQYAGALPMCGLVGGSAREVQYVADVRALFDVFYPGVLPGSATELPKGVDLYRDVIGPAQAAMIANPGGAFAISRIVQTPIEFSSGRELVTTVLYDLGFHTRFLQDVLDRTHGRAPFDNASTVYAGALPQSVLDMVNASVQRFSSTPDARNVLEHYYEPTGDLRIPVLTLHTLLDPAVPRGLHEPRYAEIVAAAGHADLLAQRTTTDASNIDPRTGYSSRYGHCTFTTQQMVSAFDDLVKWVDTGVKPGM